MSKTDFVGRICLPDNKPPVRAYVHKAGFVEVYDNYLKNAENHLKQVLKENKRELSGFQYMLATIWGDKGNKMIDMFGYNNIIGWPGNPSIYAWVMENGVFIPTGKIPPKKELTCEDTSILLGKEAEHRRNRKSLKDFISNPPLFINSGEGHIKIIPLEKRTSSY